ncbi:glycoside hydrolase family 16 protein [Schizophyllum amplum]|uniref:Glycoside hydrolase family 16 protein n=1 Tax=Schizophyllum amplum TaxID=97359 RepID=A0A550CP10_9AGAR|nr:glycoside hydrolase family 16 protein [Auriculariopsis ampla]
MKAAVALSALVTAATPALAATYLMSESFIGEGFYDNFDFQAIADPTHGRVNYVDQATAVAQNLTYASSDSFILRMDSTTVLDPAGPGRNSVRLRSKNTYTKHVAVINLRHMPQGCGTWPAIWETLEATWPAGGEVDILEGVNDVIPNAATLHTSPGCTMPMVREQLGAATQPDCDTAVNGNAGCGVKFSDQTSFGPALNAQGGGWYALERTDSFMKVWYWPRGSPNVPVGIADRNADINTDNWGTPQAFFPGDTCNIAEYFDAHNIIINLTLCGDWAGATFNTNGCAGSCVDLANNNPGAFTEAYFDIANIDVYTVQ